LLYDNSVLRTFDDEREREREKEREKERERGVRKKIRETQCIKKRKYKSNIIIIISRS